MNVYGGGGPEGGEGTAGGGGVPAACNQVRIVNQDGGIMECLTIQEACARGIIGGSVCAETTASTVQLTSAEQATSLAVSQAPQTSDSGCLLCAGIVALLVIMTSTIRRKS